MRSRKILASLALGLTLAFSPLAHADQPYTEGTVWTITFVKTKPGMQDAYLRELGGSGKALMEAAKRDGLVLSEHIFMGLSGTREDFDVMIMTEYKNYAAFDGLAPKFDALAAKLIGTEEKQMQMMTKRGEIREILGEKVMQEVQLK